MNHTWTDATAHRLEKMLERVYKGRPGIPLEFDQCSHRVWNVDHWTQCSRGVREVVEAYGFCKQHADMIEKWLEEKNE